VGYRTDAVVLRRLLGHNYRCLGVLSSTTKVTELAGCWQKRALI